MTLPLSERVTTLHDIDNAKDYHAEVRVCKESQLIVSYRKDLTAEIAEVQFDVYDETTQTWTNEFWSCVFPNIDALNATDKTVRINNHR
jgi:hypothetical protein|tara:strand:- start:8849 stop:9115 length:267 start_codon:yes stop_codon:yes gene_type:complete